MSIQNEIVIEITPEDAKNAKEYLCNECLLGTAVKRQLNPESMVVGSSHITINSILFLILEWKKIRDTYGSGISQAIVEKSFQVTLRKKRTIRI